MTKYVIKRILYMIPVLLGVSFLVFTILSLTPGDPGTIMLGITAKPEDIARLNEEFGYNRPFFVRFFDYIKNIVLHFDLGTSYATRQPVIQSIVARFPNTLLLAFLAMIVESVLGVSMGIISAVRQYTRLDRVMVVVALVFASIPGFWLALMLVLAFSVKLGWLPAYGIGGFQYYILPTVSTALAGVAINARQTRSAMLDVIRADYVTTAKAKGVNEHDVIYKHALPNALIPIITVIGGSFAGSLGGTVIAESIFTIPGIGLYLTDAIAKRDYPAIRGSVVILAIFFSLIMLLVDLIYAFVDPRIKAQYSGKG